MFSVPLGIMFHADVRYAMLPVFALLIMRLVQLTTAEYIRKLAA